MKNNIVSIGFYILGCVTVSFVTATSYAGQTIYQLKESNGTTLLTNKQSRYSHLKVEKKTYYPDSNIHSYTNWGNSEASVLPSYSRNKNAFDHIIKQAASQHGISEGLIKAVMHTESGFNANARSPVGAQGLMQVVPRFHRDKIAGRSILNIDTNVEVGTQVLGDCLLRHKGATRLALKCYSGGARNYTEKLSRSYKDIKRYDVVYRFENEIPITVTSSFQNPGNFSHSPPSDFITVAGIQ